MNLSLPSPRRAAAVLIVLTVLLAVLYAVSRAAVLWWGVYHDIYPIRLVNLNGEGNLPSLFSGTLLLAASALLSVIASAVAAGGGDRRPWLGLALLFCFLSLDEWLGFHERASHIVRWLGIGGGGVFHFAWVIPYGLGALALGAAYLHFLIGLPARTRVLFIASGAFYVGGAAGCEMASGLIIEASEVEGLFMSIEILIEETLEMTGVSTFIYALLDYWRAHHPKFRVSLSASKT